MNRRSLSLGGNVVLCLVAMAFGVSSCGGGADLQMKLNRIHFLKVRKKDPEAALKFAKEAYQDEEGAARSRLLMEGASLAFQLYLKSTRKAYLMEMFSLLEIIINEKLPDAPDAYVMCSNAYSKMGNFEKALQYARKAVSVAPRDQGGKYQHAVMDLHLSKGDHRMVIREAEALILRYPKYKNIDRIKEIKRLSEVALMEERRRRN